MKHNVLSSKADLQFMLVHHQSNRTLHTYILTFQLELKLEEISLSKLKYIFVQE